MFSEDSDFLKIEDHFQRYSHIKSTCVRKRLTHENATFSIVIPTYKDTEGFLVRAIDSVSRQEDFDDYNVLIVCNSHKKEEDIAFLLDRLGGDRISYYENEENIGMCGNWNRCIELSNAKYTIMLHDDDYIMPTYLKEVKKVIEKRPNVGMIVTNRTGEYKINLIKAKHPFERFHLLDLFPANQLAAPSGMLLRTDYVKRLGGWNEENACYFDCWFNALFLVHYPVYVSPLKLTYYRSDMSRYAKGTLVALSVGEYLLFLQAMLYSGINSKIAKIVAMNRLIEKIRGYTLTQEDVPIKVIQYGAKETLWARRYIRYVSKILHWWVNLVDKTQAKLYINR